MMGGANSRAAVRDLYKRVVRLGNTWEARNPAQTPKEREYILEEARTLFHEHMHETDPREVQRLVHALPNWSPPQSASAPHQLMSAAARG